MCALAPIAFLPGNTRNRESTKSIKVSVNVIKNRITRKARVTLIFNFFENKNFKQRVFEI